MTTKIHAVVDALGNPLRFILTPGQASDFTQAEALIADLPAKHVLGDKCYDSRTFRDAIHAQDAVPVIPPRKTSPQAPCDYALYCERNLIERLFLKIKHFRRVATRYDQTPRAFRSFLAKRSLDSAPMLLAALSREPAFSHLGFQAPRAENLREHTVLIPMYAGLTDADVDALA